MIAAAPPVAEQVVEALRTVRDPELDQDVVELGFVAGLAVGDDGSVQLALRVPTFFCSPNFVFLMASDARAALAGVPGVRAVEVSLVDYYAADEINEGLSVGRSFDQVFDGEGDGNGLEDLRSLFRRKAFVARQQRLCEALLAAGWTEERLASATLADLPDGEERATYLHRRAELDLAVDDGEPLVVTAGGQPVGPERMRQQLRIGRTVRVSIEGNAGLCRGLLKTRYGREETTG